jgi:DNA-binding NarL/FixJ family response regulator
VFVLFVITLRRWHRQPGVGKQLPGPVPGFLPAASFAVVARLRAGEATVATASRPGPHALTGRQREVFDLLAAGLRNPEIAAALHISPKTVGHHVAAIFTKLGVQNRTQAVAYSLQDPAASDAEL